MLPPRADPRQDDGFITPVFAGLVLMLGLVAAGVVMLARQDLSMANRDARLLAKDLWLEGIARNAALDITSRPGQSVLRWREGAGSGDITVTAEPEDRKIDPRLTNQAENVDLVARLVGDQNAHATASAITDLAVGSDRLLRREQVRALASDPRWRACATTIMSPYGRMSRLAPDASSSGPPSDPRQHVGEIWRIFVESDNGPWLDQIVQLTNNPGRPVEVLDQVRGRTRQARQIDCWKLIGREGDVDAIR